ncbi:MAG: phosphonate metabolism protein/1,5-bisphosphokinase (PRPP-forming) PhnN [Bradyrhizobium sp.]|nr:phosphonate metabolism protein/1,5-bisphosphokinase (PRPP-forming) PhnN [Bradyrhizobium sp.]
MTEATTICGDPAATGIGPGRLVLVVGPSGAGKDTLIGLVRAVCAGGGDIVFPRRVVTREASSSEDNEHLRPAEFRQAQVRGEFSVHWEAHGHCYGLRRAIDDEIRAGRTVVANASRTVVGELRRAYADVMVVSITAPAEILAERLAARARGSDGRVADRLSRAVEADAAPPDVVIMNVGNAEDHALELLRIISDACSPSTTKPRASPSS